MENRIELIQGDITKLEIDGIVNAANRMLLGGGGVDGAIHQAAGFKLKDYCRKFKGCGWGEARISPGFDLPARHVIHAVGPIYGRQKGKEPVFLRNAYFNSLNLALENELKVIAFPNISTGAYNYPLSEAAEIAIETVVSFLEGNEFPQKVIFVCFGKRNLAVYSTKLIDRGLIPA